MTASLERCNGQDYSKMLAAATAWLEKHAQAINALNVFPVPDGDTGTNMLLTMQAALKEVNNSKEPQVHAVAQSIAYGALMGARGNSGVILSQLFRGFANGLHKAESFGALEFGGAMKEASVMAYKGIIEPVEGTILTVGRDAAEAALAAAKEGRDLLGVFERTVAAAQESVANTPNLLQVLREAGVVDAGGQGLFIIFDGMLRYLRGERIEAAAPMQMVEAEAKSQEKETGWGYCTEFILKGDNMPLEEIRDKIASMGVSVLVVGDGSLIKAHLHTFEPGEVLSYAATKGALHQVKVDNMQEQHREFLLLREGDKGTQEKQTAVVAVVSGSGLVQVFESLGADRIIPGGKTMNPSTQEILQAIEAALSPEVVILPNDENIFMAAKAAQKLCSKKVTIVPSKTIPQGIAALLAFNPRLDLDGNHKAMEKAIAEVHTIEITTAIRPAKFNGIKVKKGSIIGLLNGELVVSGDDIAQVVKETLNKLATEKYEIITLYYGEGTGAAQAQGLAQNIEEWYPEQEVECIDGGQPHYHYIISVE